ncbi:ABC transporter, CydDC cysteine exporter family, permease/ATP-binding protein CydD [Deinococcus aerius]|uniref:ABC transporter, CydDC cysteine exporter family, permease/ATP-binding protein CydD n=2 Tax=Deinococcus aerius TaxID=200253 RepID=A0A2I9DDE7_9DEIO|nr:ABC transporter, CydDC cysteine exporter family, permease/ATP-binding protein CydD [Deinococcus aerius]
MRPLMRLPGVRPLALACAGLALVTCGLVLAQWSLVARIVNGIFLGRQAPAVLTSAFVALALVWLVRSALVGVRDVIAARAAAHVKREVRGRLLAHLLSLGPLYAAGQRAGELTELVVEGAERLEGFVGRFVPGSVFAAVLPPLLALTVLFLDPLSGLILLFTGPVIVVLLWLVGTMADQAAKAQWLTLGRLSASFVDTLRGLPTLVVFGRDRERLAALRGADEAYRRVTLGVLRTAFLSGFVLEFGATLSTALVAVTVGVRLFEGALPFERAFLVLLLAPEFFAPLRALGADHHASLEARAAGERMFAVLNEEAPGQGGLPVPEGPLRIEFRDVTLQYGERTALRDVSLTLPPGSRLLLVGESGAGKTSVARLLLGFAVPTSGEVRVNGVSLADLDPAAWRERIAYVPERPYLFPGTVRENIRLGRPDATDDEVVEAARAADAHTFISGLAHRYDTEVGAEGARLSGGERLRLALARAFLRDAEVLILDEPTSQLDAGSEEQVRAALERLGQGRTVLTISHRAALHRGHDQVIELEGGRVREPVGEWA